MYCKRNHLGSPKIRWWCFSWMLGHLRSKKYLEAAGNSSNHSDSGRKKTESQATLAIRRLGRRTPFLGSCKRISREQVHIPPMGNGKSSTQKCLSRGYVIVSERVICCWDATTSECNDSFKLRTRTLPHEVANSHLYSWLHSFCVAPYHGLLKPVYWNLYCSYLDHWGWALACTAPRCATAPWTATLRETAFNDS